MKFPDVKLPARLGLPSDATRCIKGADGLLHGLGLDFHRETLPPNKDVFLRTAGVTAPSSADNSGAIWKVLDQGQEGSCTAHAWSDTREAVLNVQGKAIDLSRQGFYNEERLHDGTPLSQDGGSQVATGAWVIQNIGEAPEADLPYGPQNLTKKPSKQWIQDAAQYKLTGDAVPQQINTLDDVKAALANKELVPFGFQVFSSFQNIGSDGIMPMPQANEQVIGGHAVTIVGYDDNKVGPDGSKGYLKVLNSWGPGWGDHGYFYMPYDFFTPDNVSDKWAVPLPQAQAARAAN